MAICNYCGNQIGQNMQFCNRCGKPAGAPVQNIVKPADPTFTGIHKYTGEYREFPFVDGLTIEVSPGKDAANEYALQFHKFANCRMRSFQQEYRQYCTNFDGYIDLFVDINGKYVREFLDEAVGLLISYGYYRLTTQDIIDVFIQTPGFKNFDDFHERSLELANAYIQDNYNRAVNRVNNMANPVFFGTGVGGMALSFGLSAASGAIQNRRADKIIANSQRLTPAQEREFFSAVREADVMYYVWDELIQVGNAVISILTEIDEYEVTLPYNEQIDEAYRLFENMQNPRFPRNQIAGAAKYILEVFPYISELYPFLKQCFGDTPQIGQIEQYFYPPHIRLFTWNFPEYGN